ncbi:DUF4169 family protein [Loktanella sp. S4079]|uniref:DUF4169 family protein n=1 Tax=Loktanella sp. S4079 TaxID=579483 RepID=UPI0008DD31A8|nr:DUF4169 family protein [Loktanella sp. S4079]
MKPINLNQARKARTRAEAKAKADANAVRFGRTKAERLLDAAREKQSQDRLSQLKFEDD